MFLIHIFIDLRCSLLVIFILPFRISFFFFALVNESFCLILLNVFKRFSLEETCRECKQKKHALLGTEELKKLEKLTNTLSI